MVLSGFVGIFFVVMPSVVCMNFFMFTAGYYAVGIFFSVLSGYLMVMHGKNIILQILAIFFYPVRSEPIRHIFRIPPASLC